MRIEGKRVLLTGASGGIGAALAVALSRKGARLILTARHLKTLRQVQTSCHNPDHHELVTMDLGEPESVQRSVQQIIARWGPVDILINNAGISQRSLAGETSLAVEQNIMAINYFACLATTKAVLPAMHEQGSGQIVVISSLTGKISTPGRSSYAASKHALHGYFEALRGELHGSGIHVTMVCPGFIRTGISLSAVTADGSSWATMDRAQAEGMAADKCARAIVTAMEKNQPELIIAGAEKIVVYLQRFFPSLYRRLLPRLAPGQLENPDKRGSE